MLPTAALLLAAISAPSPMDLAPTDLAIRPNVIERSLAPYDWSNQQGRHVGARLAYTDSAACDTGPICHVINGQQVCYHDCRFD